MILVDTSVWVDHLRNGLDDLRQLLLDDHVVCHPFIIGELACGNMRRRSEIIGLLHRLPAAPKAADAEVLHMIEQHGLMGRGLGLIDIHLLASCLLAKSGFWTTDRRLSDAAAHMGIAVQ